MQHRDFQSNYKENFLDWWNNITLVRKPIVAAVNGYAFGGGCEVNLDLSRLSPASGHIFTSQFPVFCAECVTRQQTLDQTEQDQS